MIARRCHQLLRIIILPSDSSIELMKWLQNEKREQVKK